MRLVMEVRLKQSKSAALVSLSFLDLNLRQWFFHIRPILLFYSIVHEIIALFKGVL